MKEEMNLETTDLNGYRPLMGLSFFSSVSILSVIKKRRKCYEVTVPFLGFLIQTSETPEEPKEKPKELPSPFEVFVLFISHKRIRIWNKKRR